MFAAGSFPVISPTPHKADNASATKHGRSGLHHSPAPAPVGLPPSEGNARGNPAYAPRHPHEYHSPSNSPGQLDILEISPFPLCCLICSNLCKCSSHTPPKNRP